MINSAYNVGDPIDLVPEYSFNVSASHDFEVAGRPSTLRVDYNQIGRSTFRNRASGAFFFGRSDVINLLNASYEVRPRDNLTVGLFVQNLLNDRGYVDPTSISYAAARARPRTFGISFNAAF